MEQKILEKYLYVVEQIKDAERMRITATDFQKIVQDTGLTERELLIVKEECDKLSKQSETYVNSNNYKKAAELVEKALAIDPYNVRNVYLAIKSNVFLYTKHYKDEYFHRINELTQHGLQLAPTQGYFAQADTLVTDLYPIAQKERFWFKLWLVGFIALVAIFAYGFTRLAQFGFDTLPRETLWEVLIWFGLSGVAFLYTAITGVIWLFNFLKTSKIKAELKGLTYQDGNSRNVFDRVLDTVKGLFK